LTEASHPLNSLARTVRQLAVSARFGELLFVAAITGVALFLRSYDLLSYPPGFHGDEGLAGFDAQRALREGWVGPYLPSSLGYPSGPAYATAAVVWVLGSSAFSVRLAPALLGTLTIPVAYAAFRVMYGYRVAVLGAMFLAFSAWHIHYSRVAYLPIAWPLMEVVTMFFLFLAVRTRRWEFFALAGLATGFGVYSYGSYPVFALGLAIFLLWFGFRRYFPRYLPTFFGNMMVFGSAACIAAFSMIQYMSDSKNNYFTRVKSLSITHTARWQNAAGPFEKGHILFQQAKHWFLAMTWKGPVDGVDAAGVGPMLDKLTVALAAAGLIIVIFNWRRLPYAFAIAMLITIPLGSIMTIDGLYRRSLGLVPVLAVLMALPLAGIWRWGDEHHDRRMRALSYGAITVVVALVAVFNVRYYFGTLGDSDAARYTFAEDLAAASRHIEQVHPDMVYFYSFRWNYGYETRAFLAPDVPGEDRSREWSKGHRVSLEADRSKEVLFVFLGGYMSLLTDAQHLYPEGQAYNGLASDHRLLYIAFLVPKETEPAAALGPP
jgi:hypothetical protein